MSSSAIIHPTAVIDPRAQLGPGVSIGAYSVLKGQVTVGPGTVVHEHCVLQGATEIGAECRIGPGAYVGMDPQHLRFVADDADPVWLIVEDNVTIREGARIARAFTPGRDHATRIGSDCLIMGAAHVAHDCVVERGVTMADGVLLGGHCHIAERAFLGGGCTIHQFVRVGRLAVIAGNEAASQDIPPFAAARYGRLKGFNVVGCRRAAFDRDTVAAIRACYRQLHAHRVMSDAVAAIRAEVPDVPEVREVLQFIASSRRGILPAYGGRSSGRGVGTAGASSEADATL